MLRLKKNKICLLLSLLVGASVVGLSSQVLASDIKDCGGYQTSVIGCPGANDKDNGIIWILKGAIKILSGLVGVVAVVMYVFAGVTYASAKDSAETVKKAKNMMLNITIGILLYMFLFTILNFLIPGGVLS